MAQYLAMRLVGAALTVGGIALAAFVNAEMPDKTIVHLAVMGIAAIISVIGIGIYEDAPAEAAAPKAEPTTASKSGKPFAPPHPAQ